MSKAIVIHSPAPNAIQLAKYVSQKYGAQCNDPKAVAEMISLAKAANRYAIAYRKQVSQKICEKLGKQPIASYDSPHNFVDEDGTFHFASQRAKVGDTPIILDENTGTVYIFEGLSNKEWKDSVTGSHCFSPLLKKQMNPEEFIKTLAPSAKLIKTLSIK